MTSSTFSPFFPVYVDAVIACGLPPDEMTTLERQYLSNLAPDPKYLAPLGLDILSISKLILQLL